MSVCKYVFTVLGWWLSSDSRLRIVSYSPRKHIDYDTKSWNLWTNYWQVINLWTRSKVWHYLLYLWRTIDPIHKRYDATQPDICMLILHGSASGNATDAASSLFRLARRYRIDDLILFSLQDLDLVKLVEAQFAVFVVSTTGNGDIPASMQAFWSTLLRDDIDQSLLEDLNFVIVGLGDSKYKQFNWTAKKLRRRLCQLGAQEVIDLVLCDESDNEGLDTSFIPFVKQFENLLGDLNGGEEPISNDILLPPVTPVSIRSTRSHTLEALTLHDRSLKQSNRANARRVKARITRNTRLSSLSHFQDVRIINFALESALDIPIDPGDVLTLVPASSDTSVDRFLELLEWQGDAESIVELPDSCKALSLFDDADHITLRDLIRKTVPLHGVPPLSMFSKLRQFTTNEDFREKFDEWEEPDGKDDVYDYITRPRRTLLEVIEDFASGIKVPIEYCLDLFGTTVPRSYSIAGCNTRSTDHDHLEPEGSYSHDVELLVAMVKYRTKIKEPRQGFASRYLSNVECKPDPSDRCQELYVTIEKPIALANKISIPSETTPLLMVCTGTGLAPLRFLLMRLFEDVNKTKPSLSSPRKVLLIFGCRSLEDDLVTMTIPEKVRQYITIFHAYSRLDGQPRMYVQDLVRREGHAVKSVVDEGGIVFLCGSSGAMPDSVREGIDEVVASGTVDHLEEKGRWWQETW